MYFKKINYMYFIINGIYKKLQIMLIFIYLIVNMCIIKVEKMKYFNYNLILKVKKNYQVKIQIKIEL